MNLGFRPERVAPGVGVTNDRQTVYSVISTADAPYNHGTAAPTLCSDVPVICR